MSKLLYNKSAFNFPLFWVLWVLQVLFNLQVYIWFSWNILILKFCYLTLLKPKVNNGVLLWCFLLQKSSFVEAFSIFQIFLLEKLYLISYRLFVFCIHQKNELDFNFKNQSFISILFLSKVCMYLRTFFILKPKFRLFWFKSTNLQLIRKIKLKRFEGQFWGYFSKISVFW